MLVCAMNQASSMIPKRLKVGWSNCAFGVIDNMAKLRSTVQDWIPRGGDFVRAG